MWHLCRATLSSVIPEQLIFKLFPSRKCSGEFSSELIIWLKIPFNVCFVANNEVAFRTSNRFAFLLQIWNLKSGSELNLIRRLFSFKYLLEIPSHFFVIPNRWICMFLSTSHLQILWMKVVLLFLTFHVILLFWYSELKAQNMWY